jgi:hypothetical protein
MEQTKDFFLAEIQQDGNGSFARLIVEWSDFPGLYGWFWRIEGKTKDGYYFRMRCGTGSLWSIWQAARAAGESYYHMERNKYPEVLP